MNEDRSEDRSVDLTSGSLYWPLMVLSAPVVVSQLLEVAYNLIDTLWVGQLGPDAVAAMAFASPIVFLFLTAGIGVEIAATALVSQHKGAGNDRRVDYVAGQSISFSLLLALGLGVVGWLVSPWLVTVVGAPPASQIHAWAVQFTRITFAGAVFMYAFFIFEAVLRGFGDTKTPMYLMALGVGLNVVLDPFLIYGFSDNFLLGSVGLTHLEHALYVATGFGGFGVPGAALATVVARGVSAVVGLSVLLSGRVGIRFELADMIPEPATVAELVRIGVPTSVGNSMRALGAIALTTIIATSGPTAVAAYGICNRLSMLVFLPSVGLAQGTSTAVGQNLGAGRSDRSERAVYYATATIAIVLFLLGIVAVIFAGPIVGSFVGGGADRGSVVALGEQYLVVVGLTFPFVGASRVITSAFRGAGKTKVDMAFSLLSLWVFRLPAAYALLHWTPITIASVTIPALGATGLWYGIAASNVVTAVLAVLWFERGTWKTGVVDSDPQASATTSD